GIGKLPDTISDRSIPIRLKRAARGEDGVEKFRQREVEAETTDLRRQIESFAAQALDAVRNGRPQMPEELSDRQQDATESLLAIPGFASKKWAESARNALVTLCVEAQDGDESIGHALLLDIRQVFDAKEIDRIPSAELAAALAEMETSPWG